MERVGILPALLLSLVIGCTSWDRDDGCVDTVLVLDPQGGIPTRSALPDDRLVSNINLLVYNAEGLLEERRYYPARQLSVSDGTVRIGTSLLNLLGEGYPIGFVVCIDAGNHGDIHHTLCLADELAIFLQLVLTYVFRQVVATHYKRVEVFHALSFQKNLLLEERFQHDGTCASLTELLVLLCAVSEA